MKKKKLKLKKKPLLILLIIIIALIFAIKFGIDKYREYQYHQTYEYKLLQKEYSMDEVKIILEKLDEDYINTLLDSDYNSYLAPLLKEKYYIRKNLDKYLAYLKDNKKEEISNVIKIVNTNRDKEYYSDTKATDIKKGDLMLVNKYNFLSEDYKPNELTNVSLSYAFEGNSCEKKVLEAFIDMANSAKEENIVLVINSSYRSFNDQKSIWEYRKSTQGTQKADAYAARAGFSEHQSGLAIDIAQYNSKESDFENTPAFTWLSNHAHEYGFILRYPKNSEDITGYSYESWHYRYVGKDVATKIKNEDITFEEYYAFYVDKE